MPRYKVGGGVEGAATTLLEHVQRQTKRREEQEDELREWHRTVQKIILSTPREYSEEAVQAAFLGQPLPQGKSMLRSFAAPKGLDLYQATDPVTGDIYRRPKEDIGSLSLPPEHVSQPGPIAQFLSRMFGGRQAAPSTGGMSGIAQVELPDPTDYLEGDIIEDDATGQQYQLTAGEWQAI